MFLCTLEQSRQMYTPNVTLLHVGFYCIAGSKSAREVPFKYNLGREAELTFARQSLQICMT